MTKRQSLLEPAPLSRNQNFEEHQFFSSNCDLYSVQKNVRFAHVRTASCGGVQATVMEQFVTVTKVTKGVGAVLLPLAATLIAQEVREDARKRERNVRKKNINGC